jgi:hypothetical protein
VLRQTVASPVFAPEVRGKESILLLLSQPALGSIAQRVHDDEDPEAILQDGAWRKGEKRSDKIVVRPRLAAGA